MIIVDSGDLNYLYHFILHKEVYIQNLGLLTQYKDHQDRDTLHLYWLESMMIMVDSGDFYGLYHFILPQEEYILILGLLTQSKDHQDMGGPLSILIGVNVDHGG